ncbi:hypothetical protein [Ottowia sp.]|uniref:hypothetical protein n=1 Tax=Ottowia sp. TaxID=1898956 RepID=UPI0025EF96F6|nr:hypothetical protein [Ottowia sp.]MBK6616356.1 hypothetical protein [Ottowia sp.]
MCTTAQEVRGTPAEEVTNEHGFPQMVDEEGSPICASCAAAVMPNRGQGMICDQCDHEFTLHCLHDL